MTAPIPAQPAGIVPHGRLTWRQFFERLWAKIDENEIMTRASAISSYAMMALVPILALLLTILVQLLPNLSGASSKASFFGESTLKQLRLNLQAALPEEGYQLVADQISRMQKNPPFALLSIGLLICLWTASNLFFSIMDSLNHVYGVKETRSFLKRSAIAIVMTIVLSAIILVEVSVVAAGPTAFRSLGLKGSGAAAAEVLHWTILAVALLFSFALTFYVAPNANQKWVWITPGNVFGVIVLIAFTLGFRVYIQHFGNYNKTYGSLAGVMILLLWFWVSSVVLLSAAQVNQVLEEASKAQKLAS